MRRFLISFGIVIASVVPVSAQTPEVVPPDQPVRIAFNSTQSTSQVSFRVMNGEVIHFNIPVSALTVTDAPLDLCGVTGPSACFNYEVTIPGFTRGSHSIRIRAHNELGHADGAPLALVAGTVPTPPTVPRVVRVEVAMNPDGSLNWASLRISVVEPARP